MLRCRKLTWRFPITTTSLRLYDFMILYWSAKNVQMLPKSYLIDVVWKLCKNCLSECICKCVYLDPFGNSKHLVYMSLRNLKGQLCMHAQNCTIRYLQLRTTDDRQTIGKQHNISSVSLLSLLKFSWIVLITSEQFTFTFDSFWLSSNSPVIRVLSPPATVSTKLANMTN